MRLIFVNRFYWPETPATGQLLADLAEACAARGHEVIVITSAAGVGTPVHQTHRGVHIQRVRGTRWAGRGLLGKAIDFATFYAAAVWSVVRKAISTTTVVAMTDPPLLGIGIWLAARLRGAAIIQWVQDVYPEVACVVAGQHWPTIFRPWRNLTWRRADRCVAVGADMAGLVRDAGVATHRVAVIPNWAPFGVFPLPRDADSALRREWHLTGKFVVMYSGNLGRVHDLLPLLDLAAVLRDEPNVAFVFVGTGAQRVTLEAETTRRGLANVSFRPPQPRERLHESLAVGDLHVVTLRAGCEALVYPSKLYGIAAAGRPALFIGPAECDVARTVTTHGLGEATTRDAIARCAAFVRRLATDPEAWLQHASAALRFAAEHDAAAGTNRWLALLEAPRAGTPAAVHPRTSTCGPA